MSNRYTIRTVSDLAAIPEDRLNACLSELRGWLQMRRAVLAMEADGIKFANRYGIDEYIWCDDDLGEARLNLKVAVA